MESTKLALLSLTNYRNYAQIVLNFSKDINIITGLNGAGKTSILDGVYYCCNGKSYFSFQDKYLYKTGESFFRIEGQLLLNENSYKLKIISQLNQSKTIDLDDKKLTSLASYVGRFPAFMIAPKDILILVESSVERRKIINRTISFADKNYLVALQKYNKLLKQRNALLKHYLKTRKIDSTLLAAINQAMIDPASYIFDKRKQYVDALDPIFKHYYRLLSQDKEQAELVYKSKLHTLSMSECLEEYRSRDLIMGKTNNGIHRDDLTLLLNSEAIKNYGSQGQLKSAIIALKLAQMDWLKQVTHKSPILLLDDIFDKLDNRRVLQILTLAKEELSSQIFISDTDENRVISILKELDLDFDHYKIREGLLVNE